MTVRYHPHAEIELSDAALFYEMRQAGLGNRFIRAVLEKEAILKANPEMGKPLNGRYREILVDRSFPYLIVYLWNAERQELFISSVFHSKRHPAKKFRSPS